MEKLYSQWWNEEVNEKYQVLKRYAYYLWFTGLAIWIIFIILYPHEIFSKSSPYFFVHSANCLFVWYFGRKGYIAKSWFSILFSEINCYILWTQGNTLWKSQGIVFEILSFVFIHSFELPFIQTSFVKSLIISKHLFLWNYHKYISGELLFNRDDWLPHLTSFLIIFLYNINSFFFKSKSYELFISRKNLENAENRLSIIFNLISDGILVLSENNEILFSNHNLTRLLGCELNSVVYSRKLLEIKLGNIRKNNISEIEYCEGKKYSQLSQSNRLIDEINLIHTLGLNEHIALGLSQLRDLNLEWKGYKVIWEGQNCVLITVRDANVIIQFEKASSEVKLRNILLRSVSHELRTPINAIAFITDDLINEPTIMQKESNLEKLRMISVSSQLLVSLVNDLMDYSRMLAGVFTIQKGICLLGNIVNNVTQLIKIQAETKYIQVITRIDPNLPEYIFTDSLRLSQVLLNLLSNSLKFTLKGKIEVICIRQNESRLKIIVKDTGIGIPSHKINTLFQEFESGYIPVINPQGCGLGLFISNRIAKELGENSIEVQSVVGKGSIFSFSVNILDHYVQEVPIYEEDIEGVPICEDWVNYLNDFDSIMHTKINPRVLIVDDSDISRILLGNLLKQNNIYYEEACTGIGAIKKVKKNNDMNRPFKVIVIDGRMPELNGWDASRAIIKMYFDGEINVLPVMIGYTALSSEADVKMCLESGMQECLVKPCNPETLVKTILKYLNSQ